MLTPGVRLSLEITLEIASGRSLTGVARCLGRPVSTVAREVARNGGRRRYREVIAERATRRRACRLKARRLASERALAREVERRLRLRHSPQQIAHRLHLEHPDEPHWWASDERGSLRRDAGRCSDVGTLGPDRRVQHRNDVRGEVRVGLDCTASGCPKGSSVSFANRSRTSSGRRVRIREVGAANGDGPSHGAAAAAPVRSSRA